MAEAFEKTPLGQVEEVILLPWKVRLTARVDTGAATSSLDAREVRDLGNNEVEILLSPQHGGLTLRLPVFRWRKYKTAQGTGRRPVVLMEVCLGSKRIQAEVNIADRSDLEFPFLVGRNLLRNHFVVDVDRWRSAPPSCPGVP